MVAEYTSGQIAVSQGTYGLSGGVLTQDVSKEPLRDRLVQLKNIAADCHQAVEEIAQKLEGPHPTAVQGKNAVPEPPPVVEHTVVQIDESLRALRERLARIASRL